jgi:hypothetical protein
MLVAYLRQNPWVRSCETLHQSLFFKPALENHVFNTTWRSHHFVTKLNQPNDL